MFLIFMCTPSPNLPKVYFGQEREQISCAALQMIADSLWLSTATVEVFKFVNDEDALSF